MWETPIYRLRTRGGKAVEVDVTTSCAPGLEANAVITEVTSFFRRKHVDTVLDFGAGALRYTFPMLRRGFNVCAVEFEDQFRRPACRKALARAKRSPAFTTLIFPKPFISDRSRFDAALLCFVLPTMPMKDERKKLLSLIQRKLNRTSYIFWMSQYGKYQDYKKSDTEVEDGWYLHPKRQRHSFYSEFKNAEIDAMMEKIGFSCIRVLNHSGHDQFRLFARGGGTWP